MNGQDLILDIQWLEKKILVQYRVGTVEFFILILYNEYSKIKSQFVNLFYFLISLNKYFSRLKFSIYFSFVLINLHFSEEKKSIFL